MTGADEIIFGPIVSNVILVTLHKNQRSDMQKADEMIQDKVKFGHDLNCYPALYIYRHNLALKHRNKKL